MESIIFRGEFMIENCKKCGKELGWRKLICNNICDEWLCEKCNKQFIKEYVIFLENYFSSNTLDEKTFYQKLNAKKS